MFSNVFGSSKEADTPPPAPEANSWLWGANRDANQVPPVPEPQPKTSGQWFGGAFGSGEAKKSDEASVLFGGPPKQETSRLDRAAQAVGLQEKEKTAYDEVCDAMGCSKIPYKYRLTGWAVCFVIAFVLSLGTMAAISSVLAGNPEVFVIPFTFSHIVSLVGSMLLSTPKVFCRVAFDKYHWGATTVYLLTIIITLVVVFLEDIPSDGRVAVIVLCFITQYLAYLWFCISQIPFAARVQKAWCRSTCGCDKCVGFFP